MSTSPRFLPAFPVANLPREPKRVQPNDPAKRGQRASAVVTFGDLSRFAVFAVHTRFDAVQWFVTDADTVDPVTDRPAVIRQADTFADAVRDWA